MSARYDAVVIGSGPNGLAAAITLARAGRSVLVRERNPEIGGGIRSIDTRGAVEDLCASVFPLAVGSRFFRSLPLEELGLSWSHPELPLACPLTEGGVAVLSQRLEEMPSYLGRDGEAWVKACAPFLRRWEPLIDSTLGPLRFPRHPWLELRFALDAFRSARGWSRARFESDGARLLFDSCAAHAMLGIDRSPSASFGLVLVLAAHAVGWPFARGGAREIANALAKYLRSLGGEIICDAPVQSVTEALSLGKTALFDVTPRQFLQLAGPRLTGRYRRALERFRYANGTFKVDWVLREPIPWQSPECRRAGTVHVVGSTAELRASEAAADRGEVAERPFLLVAQPTIADPSRARELPHSAWAYCHIPNGSTGDMTERIEAQIERFAPGFRSCVASRLVRSPAILEAENPNLVGGDISGGLMDLRQLFFRPAVRLDPYSTPIEHVYLCSSSTPPGGGVHGLCGYYAARAALRGDSRVRRAEPVA